MLINLNKTQGLYNSQRVLLSLIDKGLVREKAYRFVQKVAMKSWEKNLDFKSLLVADENIRKYLNLNELNGIFDLKYHFKHVEKIFKKVLG